jgi:sirohydrochlorin cobaltochelatase
MKDAILVVGHGSRSVDAVGVFRQIVDEVRKKSGFTFVEGAHMELAEPRIEDVVSDLASREINRIIITPYFLYEGIHLKKDIPGIISMLSEKYPAIEFRLARAIGFEPVMADILLSRAMEKI